MNGVPSRGSLTERHLPDLLLALAASGASGTLRITAGGERAEIQLAAGHPVRCELAGDTRGVIEWLEASGELARDAAERARTTARTRGCTQEQALLGLELVGPRLLVGALRGVAGQRLVALGRHDTGTFEFDASAGGPDGAEALRADPLPIAQEIVETHWRPDRMLQDLTAWGDAPIRLSERGADVAARLAPRDGVVEVVSGLGSATMLWSLLGSASRPSPIAALWILARTGSLETAPAAPAEHAAGSDGEAAPESAEAEDAGAETRDLAPEIEIVLTGAPAAAPIAESDAKTTATDPGAEDDAAGLLRADILEKHERLADIDHYELLGIERDSDTGQIKRAYLRAAKRFHPDALGRLGLQHVKKEAGEIFAQIAKAQATLCDPDARRDYDAALDGHRTIDADQVAQAEILYRKGETLMRAGNFREAVDYMEASTELWPDDPAYHAAFGWCLYKNHPPDEARAREQLEKAIEIDAEFAQAHLRLAIVLKTLGDEDGAAQHAQRGKQLDPAARP